VFSDGSVREINLGGRVAQAYSLNNFDMLVGWSEVGYNVVHAFLYDPEGRSGLGTGLLDLTKYYGTWLIDPNSVNDAGDMLASVHTPTGDRKALVSHGVVVPLESLLVDPSLKMTQAYQLNARHQFLAWVVGPDGVTRQAVLTPTP